MNEQLVTSILNDLNASSFDITASAVVATDGLPIATVLQRETDPDRVGGISAALLSLGNRATKELRCGTLDQVMVKGDDGYILMMQVGTEAVLVITAKETATLGMILLKARTTVKQLSELKTLATY